MSTANDTTVQNVLLAVQDLIIAKSATICAGTSATLTADNVRVMDAEKFIQAEPEIHCQIVKGTESYPGARSGLDNLRSSVRVVLFRRQVSDDFGSLDKAMVGPAGSGLIILLDRLSYVLDQKWLSGYTPSLNLLLPLRLESASVIDGAPQDTGFGWFRGFRDFTYDIERTIEEFG